MGRIVGVGAKKAPKTYTEEDIKNITNELDTKIEDLENELANANSTIDSLNAEKVSLLAEIDTANKEVKKITKELEKNSKNNAKTDRPRRSVFCICLSRGLDFF